MSDYSDWVRTTFARVCPIKGSLGRPLILVFQRPERYATTTVFDRIVAAGSKFGVQSHDRLSHHADYLGHPFAAGRLALYKESLVERAQQVGLFGECGVGTIDEDTRLTLEDRFVRFACDVFDFEHYERPWFAAQDVIALGILRREEEGVPYNFARQTRLARFVVDGLLKGEFGYRDRVPAVHERLEGTPSQGTHVLELHQLVLGEELQD